MCSNLLNRTDNLVEEDFTRKQIIIRDKLIGRTGYLFVTGYIFLVIRQALTNFALLHAGSPG